METRIIATNIDGQFELDLPNNLDLNITFQAGDIRKVLTRNASFSKTFSFPATSFNNQFFKNIYDVKVDSTFNVNKKVNVIVIQKGRTIFDGYLKLDSVKNINGVITYECTIYSQVANFLDDFGTMKCSELDFSEYTHQYNRTNIIGSWNDFIYLNGNKYSFNYGKGYIYPDVDFGLMDTFNPVFDSGDYYTAEYYRPALYLKTVIDKMFETVGLTYKSKFFNSEYFKKMIVVSTNKENLFVSDSSIENTKVIATQDSDILLGSNFFGSLEFSSQVQATINYPKNTFDNDSTGGNQDNNNHFITDTYTATESGQYSLSSLLSLGSYVQYVTDWDLYGTTPDGDLFPISARQHVKGKLIYYSQICIDRGGVVTRPADLYQSIEQEIDDSWRHNGALINLNDEAFHIQNDAKFNLEAGDKVYIETGVKLDKVKFWVVGLTPVSRDILFKTKELAGSHFYIEMESTAKSANRLETFKSYLSDDKCKDFFLSVCKMFNLFFTVNPENRNEFIIEPRVNFYNDSNLFDWNYKLDNSKEIEVNFTSEFESEKIKFTYVQDSDYFNAKYKNENNEEIYSSYTYRNDKNDFVTKNSTEKIDLIFAPSPLVTVKDSNNNEFTNTAIYKYDESSTKKSFQTSKMRILFYGGLLERSPYKFTENYLDSTHRGDELTLTSYPYAGMLDNPSTPKESLEFGFPLSYYYKRNNVTNSTLFNNFWFDFLQTNFGSTNKLMTAYFYLTENDVANFDFRNIIYLDSRYWIVNKIIDYNPKNNSVTKVELLLIENYQKIKNSVADSSITGATYNFSSRFEVPFNPLQPKNTLVNLKPKTINLGYGNLIPSSSESVGVIGSNNNTGNVSGLVLGSNNNIYGSKNVLVLGTNNNIKASANNALIVGDSLNEDVILSNSINVNKVNFIGTNPEILLNGVSTSLIGLTGNSNELLFNVSGVTTSYSGLTYDKDSSNFIIGDSNQVIGTSLNSFISGQNNILDSTRTSAILAGTNNEINNSTNSSILGGIYTKIEDSLGATSTGFYSTLSGSNFSSIFGSWDSKIIGGQSNFLTGGYYLDNGVSEIIIPNEIIESESSSILGGRGNKLTGSTNSSIVGGTGNTLTDSISSIILGANDLNLSGKNETVLVKNIEVTNSIVVQSGSTSFSGLTGTFTIGSNNLTFINGILVQFT